MGLDAKGRSRLCRNLLLYFSAMSILVLGTLVLPASAAPGPVNHLDSFRVTGEVTKGAPVFQTMSDVKKAGGGIIDGALLGVLSWDYGTRVASRIPFSERQWVRHHRIQINWARVEPAQDAYDFSYYDQEINARLADGAQSIMILFDWPVPEWARDPSYGSFADKAPPRDLRDWYDFCSRVAERYGMVVDFYEIWNEPGWDRDSTAWQNYGVYHFGGQVETEYLPLLQLGYQAIKEKDPTAAVVCGDLQCVNDPNPDKGAELYGMLFDDVNRPGQDVSVKVEASQPIVAERPMYFKYNSSWDDGHDSLGATAPSTDWYFAEGCTRTGFNTYLCLQNPSPSDIAQVNVEYFCGDGFRDAKTVNIEPQSRFTIAVHGNGLGIGVHDSPRGDVSIKVHSEVPIVAERPMYFDYAGGKKGGHVAMGVLSPSTLWYFAEGCTGYSIEEYLCLQNPQDSTVEVSITFMMIKGEVLRRTLALNPRSRTTICLNNSIGYRGSCDMVAVHPYKLPKDWGRYYENVVNMLRSRGAWQEVVVSEAGWPHYSDTQPYSFSEQEQAEAIGALGVGSLLQKGCRKIWVYQLIDEDPGTSWDHLYCGLFRYDGAPCLAWEKYKQWQQSPYFPSYPNLPSFLP